MRNRFLRADVFSNIVKNDAARHQVYISKSNNPYINLSIEHYLLQNTPKHSRVLFLYANSPCVVIGRNQNPWKEVNLNLIGSKFQNEKLLLVRRRSGGGTVFHDLGNMNYGVICPSSEFQRDKHAQMVVKALRACNVDNARVNERYDIVLKQDPVPRKVSGSAYKITRNRSLHHGTCLLSSPNLSAISMVLRAPGSPFIKSRGVESVRSPVANAGVSPDSFLASVVDEFGQLYGFKGNLHIHLGGDGEPIRESDWAGGFLSEDSIKNVPEIMKGVEELQSSKWTYQQTPQFEISLEETPENVGNTVARHPPIPSNLGLKITAKSGRILSFSASLQQNQENTALNLSEAIIDKKIHEVRDWTEVLLSIAEPGHKDMALRIGELLNFVLGKLELE